MDDRTESEQGGKLTRAPVGAPEVAAATAGAPGPASDAPAPSAGPEAAASSRAEDMALVEAARRGEPRGFEVLFEKYREKVYRVAFGYVHDKNDALDIAQEAFVKAFKNLASFQGKSGFYTWLTQIAINLAIDFRRRMRRKKIVSLEDYTDVQGAVGGAQIPPEPGRRLQERELRERYFEALDSLSEKHRTVFLLHTVEGMAYKEIAATLEISIGTVMSRLHYARKHLQSLLGDYLRT